MEVWRDALRKARTYEEWEAAALQLDVLLGNDLWSVVSHPSPRAAGDGRAS